MDRPINKSDDVCPMHKRPVREVCHDCPWYTLVRGRNPQTGGDIDNWGCAVAWMPLLTVEVAQQTRQGAAATESFRNEMVKPMEKRALEMLAGAVNRRAIPG